MFTDKELVRATFVGSSVSGTSTDTGGSGMLAGSVVPRGISTEEPTAWFLPAGARGSVRCFTLPDGVC